MNFEHFKNEIKNIKYFNFIKKEKEQKEYTEICERVIKGLIELAEKLKPYIEYATKEFDLSAYIKEIENTVPSVYTAYIRWGYSLDDIHFVYKGIDISFVFSLKDITKLDKRSLLLIEMAFSTENLDYFVENLLKKLETDNIYVGEQH